VTGATVTSTLRRPRLDRASVIEAARDLLDDQGIEAFSMSRLGDRLGVTAMALYRHVADRADLERAVAELVLADLGGKPSTLQNWPEAVATWMDRVRDHWRRHPWLGRLLGNPTELSPPWLAALDRLAGILEDAGFPPDVVARELVRISRATAGTVVLENAAPLAHSSRLFDGLPDPDRARWGPIVAHLARYSDDDLFADLTADTLIRLRSTLT
jgi:TetR/AcrR family tetracycline transcriptional repressor